jgi:hypothetical protein
MLSESAEDARELPIGEPSPHAAKILATAADFLVARIYRFEL